MQKRFIPILLSVFVVKLAVVSLVAAETPAADYYVAPGGHDVWSGKFARPNESGTDGPFATLARARDAVREGKAGAGLKRPVMVLLGGGVYTLQEGVTFGPEDSGTEQYSITYAAFPGEKAVLSGGQKISGWKKGVGKIWTAELPEVKAGGWYFRQLFINGRRAVRARTPNADDKVPWWIIKTSTISEQEDQPFTVTVNHPIPACTNPSDVEIICIYNNEGGRKRLQAVDEKQQTLTVAPPHKWNPKCFGNDWYLSAPTVGKACYLENALELLDQPGEWYLDRASGVLSYWPRSGEDLLHDEVVAPLVQKAALAIAGTAEQPVVNLHFRGISVEYIDLPLPPWGYNGLFSCNVATGSKEQPGHRFIEAAVEMENAQSCSFTDGAIAHVGGMGLCARDGTGDIRIEGSELYDLGGGGIGAGGCNVAGGYLHAAPPPAPDAYRGYRITNNYIHHCGTDYYGGSGICLYLAQEAVISHNLVHDTAYFGIAAAGSQDPAVPFAKNNIIEYNHIYNAMQVTVDGAGLYITFANYDRGTLVRGNLIHDTQWNPFGRGEVASGIHDTIACHGLYLDGSNTGCQYVNNVVYRNAGGPLLFNSAKSRNIWIDNLFQKDGTPPQEFIEAMAACTGLEPAYQQSLLKQQPNPCTIQLLSDSNIQLWSAYQFDLPQQKRGVVEIFQHTENLPDSLAVKLRGLEAEASYEIKGYAGTLARADRSFYEGTFFGTCDQNLFTVYLAALEDLPILSSVQPIPLEVAKPMTGRQLLEKGLTIHPAETAQVFWMVYTRVN